MAGRHAAPPDEAFDQRERDRAGSHRADVDVALTADAVAPVKKPAARAKAAPVKKAAAPAKKPSNSSTPKKAGTS